MVAITDLEKRARLGGFQRGNTVDSTLGILAFEGRSRLGNTYWFVSHHRMLIRVSPSAIARISDEGIYFDDSIPTHLGRDNPKRGELSVRPLLTQKPKNRLYQDRMALYEKARELAIQ